MFSLQVVEMGRDKAPTVTLTNNLKVTYNEMNHAKRKQIAGREGGRGRADEKQRSTARTCQLLFAFFSYLSDDLAVLSVDLNDASPLCQEGEDLI